MDAMNTFQTVRTKYTSTTTAKQSKIPVLKNNRKYRHENAKTIPMQHTGVKGERENSDVFNLEELLCDIQDSIEKKQPNFLEEMKEILSEQKILQEIEKSEKNRLLLENHELQHKWEESKILLNEIKMKLEEESSRTKDLEIKLKESMGEQESLKASLELTL